MEEDLLKILLRHAEYSFADVGWQFDQLTEEEKRLVQSQETLDRLKRLRDKTLGKPLIEILDDEQFPLFV